MLWTAQQQNSGSWSGEFVSSDGTVTLPNVSYTGSLSAVQPGTIVPALDAGAGNEVYPLTGSDKWIRDLIGVVGGIKYYLSLLYTAPPSGATIAPPSPLIAIEMTVLAAETLFFAAITLLLLAVAAEIIAPGPVGGWLRARFNQKSPLPRHAQGFANTPDRDA